MEQAAELLGLSKRQVMRLRKGVEERGIDALNHGNKGKPPSTTISVPQRQKIIGLYSEKYEGANFQHFTELLEEHEGIKVSETTVRTLLKASGIQSPRGSDPALV